jgi:hypothetical protein
LPKLASSEQLEASRQNCVASLPVEAGRFILSLRLIFNTILDKDRKNRVEALPAKHYGGAESNK